MNKYKLSYTFDEGIQGGILGTVGGKALTKKGVIREIEKYVFSEEWSRWLKGIIISIKKSGQE